MIFVKKKNRVRSESIVRQDVGVGLGSLLNVVLDPLFMFVLLPAGYEVLGAGIATLLSNVISLLYFILMFRKLRNDIIYHNRQEYHGGCASAVMRPHSRKPLLFVKKFG